MNELTTEYWNSYTIYKYFVIQNIEISGINRSASFIKGT